MKLQSQLDHPCHSLAHAPDVILRLNDVGASPEEVNPRILLVHSGDGGYLKLLLDDVADLAAGCAVAPGVEGRPGNKKVGLVVLDEAKGLLGRLVQIFSEVVIAAEHRCHNLAPLTQGLLQHLSRPDGPLFGLGLDISRLLAPDSSEELVQKMHNPKLFH